MKKFSIKRIISVILTLCMLLSAFVVHASAATVSESESNNDYSSANDLKPGNTIKGKIGETLDVDFYKIEVSSNGKISLTFKHTYAAKSRGWTVTAYTFKNGKIEQLFSQNITLENSESISLPIIGAVSYGKYYISVSDMYTQGYSVGKEYQITCSFTSTNYYEKEFNDDYTAATDISLGNTYGGNISSTLEVDFYKITTENNGRIDLEFKHSYDDSSRGWTVKVFTFQRNEYVELSSQNIILSDTTIISIPSIGAVKSGIYYISVSDMYSQGYSVGKEYQIITSFTKTEYYEKELNDDYYTATSVKIGDSFGGNISKTFDVDYYRINNISNGKLELTFEHEYASSTRGWTVSVYEYSNGNYTIIQSKDIILKDGDSVTLSPINTTSEKTYYVKVADMYTQGYSIGREYTIKFGGKPSTTNYTVTYNANGGTVSPPSETIQQGDSVTLPTPKKSYTISYNANGGSGAPSSQSVTIGCKGWSKSSSATSASYSCGASYKPSSSETLYAVWNSSALATLSSSKPSRTGYNFLGWSTSSDASSAAFSEGDSVTVSGNVTLYAVWEEKDENDDGLNIIEILLMPVVLVLGAVPTVLALVLAAVTFPIWIWFVL